MSRRTPLVPLLAIAASAVSAHAQKAPPIRDLKPVIATSAELLGAVSAVRALPGGRLLLNDINARRLVLFDSTLAVVSVVADSASGSASGYGMRAGGLIAWHGDSSAFVDPSTLSMLVIDAAGQVARVIAVPRPSDAAYLTGLDGTPGLDAQGRLIYRGVARPRRPATAQDPNIFSPPATPDSAPLIRVDLATRAFDTVAVFRIPKLAYSVAGGASGRFVVQSLFNPLPAVDDWAVMPDGSVAVVRGGDYHVDWIGADGRATSSPKLPFEWKRLTPEEKTALLDSSRVAMEKVRAEAMARAGVKDTVSAPPTRTRGTFLPPVSDIKSIEVYNGSDPSRVSNGRVPPPVITVDEDELPDYVPPFAPRAARADAEGRLWIRTSLSSAGGPVYDVVSRAGELVDRVRIPVGRVIAGFGPGGVVYMGVRDGAGSRLERARAP